MWETFDIDELVGADAEAARAATANLPPLSAWYGQEFGVFVGADGRRRRVLLDPGYPCECCGAARLEWQVQVQED